MGTGPISGRTSSRGILRGAILFAAILALTGGHSLTPCRAQGSENKIAAQVNTEVISEAQYVAALKILRGNDFLVGNPPRMRPETAGQLAIMNLVNERLILQFAAKTNQLPSDTDVSADLDALKAQSEVMQLLNTKQVTEEDLKSGVRVRLAYYNLATTAVSMTPTEVEDYYKQHVAAYTIPEKWTLVALRTSKEDMLTKIDADIQAKKPFIDIVKSYSEDEQSKANGGLIGTYVVNDPRLPGPFREAVRKLKVGDIAGPIKLDVDQGPNKPHGTVWFYLRLVTREQETVRPFNEVKRQVEKTAMLERAGGFAIADKKILQFRKESDIKINMPEYQNLYSTP